MTQWAGGTHASLAEATTAQEYRGSTAIAPSDRRAGVTAATREWKVVTRNCAAPSGVVWAEAAAARLGKTRTLVMAPQKAPMPPISAATVARAEPRFLVSVAIAAYETASAPSPRIAHVPAAQSCVSGRAVTGSGGCGWRSGRG